MRDGWGRQSEPGGSEVAGFGEWGLGFNIFVHDTAVNRVKLLAATYGNCRLHVNQLKNPFRRAYCLHLIVVKGCEGAKCNRHSHRVPAM
jgi:hypothetical protein